MATVTKNPPSWGMTDRSITEPQLPQEDRELLRALNDTQARALRPLLRQQARSNQRYRSHNPVSLDQLQAA